MDKNTLRKKAKEIRNSLDIKEISKKICKEILADKDYKNAKNILIFYPLKNEIDLTPLLNDVNKNFYLPKVQGTKLLICPYKKGDELELSKFKTKEPKTLPLNDLTKLDLVFVPALMADRINNRLGYGGGFYDRFLSKLPTEITTIVPIAKELVIDKIPFDDFDEVVDKVITQS